jgi:hypothetical protein
MADASLRGRLQVDYGSRRVRRDQASLLQTGRSTEEKTGDHGAPIPASGLIMNPADRKVETLISPRVTSESMAEYAARFAPKPIVSASRDVSG